MKKRVKYNWFFAIEDLNLNDEFAVYKAEMNLKHHLKHKKVLSENRLARGFIYKYSSIFGWSWMRHCPSWILGKEVSITYEPNDYDSDIGSATVDEMRIQNVL